MTVARRFALTLTVAAGLCASVPAPAPAQTRTEIETASAAPLLDLTSGSDEAIRAAKVAQEPKVGRNAPTPVAAPVAPAQGQTLDSLTVPARPDRTPRVVASTEANPLSAPNFSDRDVDRLDLAVSVGPNTTLGAQTVDNTHAAGFLAVNPQGGPTRTDVGLTSVFATR